MNSGRLNSIIDQEEVCGIMPNFERSAQRGIMRKSAREHLKDASRRKRGGLRLRYCQALRLAGAHATY